MITLLIFSLFGDTLASDVDPANVWLLAGFEGLLDALIIVILVAIIGKAFTGG